MTSIPIQLDWVHAEWEKIACNCKTKIGKSRKTSNKMKKKVIKHNNREKKLKFTFWVGVPVTVTRVKSVPVALVFHSNVLIYI